MTTPSGPGCHHCHPPFNGRKCFVEFHFIHFRYCSEQCLKDAVEERRKRYRADEFRMEKHGRHWKVVDENGELVVIAISKEGASEVVRRLSRREPAAINSKSEGENIMPVERLLAYVHPTRFSGELAVISVYCCVAQVGLATIKTSSNSDLLWFWDRNHRVMISRHAEIGIFDLVGANSRRAFDSYRENICDSQSLATAD